MQWWWWCPGLQSSLTVNISRRVKISNKLASLYSLALENILLQSDILKAHKTQSSHLRIVSSPSQTVQSTCPPFLQSWWHQLHHPRSHLHPGPWSRRVGGAESWELCSDVLCISNLHSEKIPTTMHPGILTYLVASQTYHDCLAGTCCQHPTREIICHSTDQSFIKKKIFHLTENLGKVAI